MVNVRSISPDEASAVSKSSNPASPGVSRINQTSRAIQNNSNPAGMKKTNHVLSTGCRSVANSRRISAASQPSPPAIRAESAMACPQSNAK